MSLSRREQLLLDRAATALRRADPDLAVKFALFRQAADGEPVPRHERLPGPGWPARAWAALTRAHHGSPRLAQEDPMSATSRISPLPPDRRSGGHSPLPPDPARDRHSSPLPPDPRVAAGSPVPQPRPAPDDQDGGSGPDGESTPRTDGAR